MHDGFSSVAHVGGLGLENVRAGRILVLAGLSVGAGVAMRSALPHAFAQSSIGAALTLGTFGAAFLVLCTVLGLFDVRALLRRRAR